MTRYGKFYAALLTVAANFVRDVYGIDLGVDPATATALVSGVGAILVWAVPNA